MSAPERTEKKESSVRRTVLLVLVAVVVIAVGATGTVLVVQQRAEQAREDEVAAERREAERERKADLAAEAAAQEACLDEASGYLEAVQDIDAVLDVGVNYEDYSDLVRDASIASRRVSGIDADCESQLVEPLDEAMVEYVAAASDWNDCIVDFDCDTDDLDLSGDYWLPASLLVAAAEVFVDGTDGSAA